MAGRRKGRLSNEELVELASEGLTYKQIAKKDGTTVSRWGDSFGCDLDYIILHRRKLSGIKWVSQALEEKKYAVSLFPN